MNHLDLKNKVAIITGGAQGFGLAISKRIIESGGKVVIWDIDENAVETALKEINSNDLSFKKVDVTNFEAYKPNPTETNRYKKIISII